MNQLGTFFAAVESGDLTTVRAMAEADPKLIHARNDDGATPLHVAAFHAHRPLVEFFHSVGADMNARDALYGATPAGWALHYLRELGAYLAIEIDDVLHALRTGDVDWVRRLVERHPEIVNANDHEGRPLSEHARETGDPEITIIFQPTDGR